MPQMIRLSTDATRDNDESLKSPLFLDPKLSSSEPTSEVLEEGTPQDSEWSTRSCMAVIGVFSIMFCSVGFITAFGGFQGYYAKNMLIDEFASDMSWFGSFNVFCMFGRTFVAEYLNNKYGSWFLVYGGSAVMLLALFMTSLCKEYYQFFLTRGFLLGVGIASILLPAFTIAAQYFTKYRGLALGIVVSGSSFLLPQESCPRVTRSWTFFFVYFGIFTPFFYIEPWALSLGFDSNFAFYTISIVNAASLFGRIIPGLLADRFGCYNIAVIASISSGLVCTCMKKATSVAGITIFSLTYGFTSGAIISLQGFCAAKLVPPMQFGIAMGSVMTFLSIAGLVGSPINGKILDVWVYLGISLFSGMTMLLGGLVLLAARLQLNSHLLAKAYV
ncbi:uncharacterized protein EAE98_002793 [Botrytis deweyae]|uniref:Major facilitator superfamily (MFS) profile domain-containing protein n=1 Tax=Botrytis deweyae TaxID=2478750 RepID=A0ABQ7IUT2_9HELO|nr:uncharacterized protein EAE98_002793 [Botrytis deweyae]KAF7934748.1 hypothetical protein EAE98_002793 [Botrytis deweyae]